MRRFLQHVLPKGFHHVLPKGFHPKGFPRAFQGLSKGFPRAFQGLSKGFPRAFQGLSMSDRSAGADPPAHPQNPMAP
jgi:hypothetical protein